MRKLGIVMDYVPSTIGTGQEPRGHRRKWYTALLMRLPARELGMFPSRLLVCDKPSIQVFIGLRHRPQVKTLYGSPRRLLSHGLPGAGIIQHLTHGLRQGLRIPGRHE